MGRKTIAPDEAGQLPNENRCRSCWRLLSWLEDTKGNAKLWCSHCQKVYETPKRESR